MPASAAGQVGQFLRQEQLDWELVSEGDCDVAVVRCTQRQESDLSTLYSGGWITCETARSLAPRLGVSLAQMGRLLDLLDVKVRRCSLGCFR